MSGCFDTGVVSFDRGGGGMRGRAIIPVNDPAKGKTMARAKVQE